MTLKRAIVNQHSRPNLVWISDLTVLRALVWDTITSSNRSVVWCQHQTHWLPVIQVTLTIKSCVLCKYSITKLTMLRLWVKHNVPPMQGLEVNLGSGWLALHLKLRWASSRCCVVLFKGRSSMRLQQHQVQFSRAHEQMCNICAQHLIYCTLLFWVPRISPDPNGSTNTVTLLLISD